MTNTPRRTRLRRLMSKWAKSYAFTVAWMLISLLIFVIGIFYFNYWLWHH